MKKCRAANNVTAPSLGDRDVDDGAEHYGVNVFVGAGSLRQLQGRGAERQVIPLQVEAQSEVLAVIAGGSGGDDSATSANIVLCIAIGQAGAAANVERPFVESGRLRLTSGNLFGRRFLIAGLLGVGLLGLRLLVGRLLGRCFLSVQGEGSRQNRREGRVQNDAEPGTAGNFRIISCDSPPAAGLLADRSAGNCTRQRQALVKERVRDVPPECVRSRQAPYYQL